MKNHHHQHLATPNANSRETIHATLAARAYELWQQAGEPAGQAEVHWLAAEQEQVAGHRTPTVKPTLPISF